MNDEDVAIENAVAIVGIACRYPGARNLKEFWDNLCAGTETITFFTPEELDNSLDPEMTSKPNYVRAKGKLDDVDKFDARFFGISPVEAKLMDPQQRLLLELSWAALEDAGIVPGDTGNLVGVWVGTNWNRYYAKHVRGSAEEQRFGEFNTQIANEFDFPASRVAYKLNLTGPAVTLATACSTSLVAVGQAMQSLLNYECNAALAGGVSVSVPLNAGYQYQEGSMLSSDGHCRPFDAKADGTTFNDGAAMVTLKRLEDALADEDEIYAVIRSVGINNDGSDKVSYTAPSVSGQVGALESALAMADIDAESVGMIETHGTATPMGDPIEVEALRRVYGKDPGAPPCALGSVKSNIGHAIHAAGVAGIIKAAMSVKEGVIPPTLHFQEPNPALNLHQGRFFVNAEKIAWPMAGPRRAGVSSFGVGGTNAHAIVEQPPAKERVQGAGAPPLLLLSAKDSETAQRQVVELAHHATGTSLSIADIGYTLIHKRARFESRTAIVANDIAELASTDADGRNVVRGRARPITRSVWAFPGQGAQRVGMGKGLIASSETYRAALAEAVSIANQHLDLDLAELVGANAEQDDRIGQTRYTQPALFVVGYALAQHYQKLGLKPNILIGHSIGEFVAACLSGVFSLEDGVRLVCERGRLMQAQPRGSMLSVSARSSALQKYIDDEVCIAVQNAPEVCVLAGPTSKLEAISEELRNEDVRVSMLQTSHAFHTSMMDGALPEFRRVVENVHLNPPRIPIVSTCTGQLLTDDEAMSPDYWINQLRNPVRFSDAIETLLAFDGGSGVALLELGPGRTLTTLFNQQAGRDHTAAPSLGLQEDDATLSSWLALGSLWCGGMPLPSNDWWSDAQCHRIKLPTYPFRRDVHWLEAVVRSDVILADRDTGAVEATLLEDQVMALFVETTGLDLVSTDKSKPFPELGLDSLLLTQIVVALQESFGVVITIKDLVAGVNTIDAVFRFIDQRTPKGSASDTDSPVSQQPALGSGLPIQQLLPRRKPKRRKPGEHRRDTRPQTITEWSDLGSRRATSLEAFITSHAERTKGSKAHTARYRMAHADPRTAAGFHRVWKEIAYPLVCTRSSGAELWDIDGNRYIDMLSGFGPNLLGHAAPLINHAMVEQLGSGIEIGPQSALAGETAALICQLTGMDRASFMCTGSEAVQAALRCARTYTRRSKIVLFEGAYHGNFDEVLVRSANQHGTLRTIPGSPGIPRGSVADVIVLPWNSTASLAVIDEIGDQLAAVMVEPVQSRTPDIQPAAFLRELREITRRHSTLLIFDEVVTGFRCHPGGAQAYFGIEADLATYGKVAGGNMPIGVVAGREAIMNTFDGGAWDYGDDSQPSASVTFFAGTFVRHPLSIAACNAMLKHLIASGPELQASLAERTTHFTRTVNELFRRYEAPFEIPNFTSVMYLRNNDISELGSLFWYGLRERGVFALEGFPSYLTIEHTGEKLEEVTGAIKDCLQWMVDSDFLIEPRKLLIDSDPTFALPLEPPAKDAKLGVDEHGDPAWFVERSGTIVNVLTEQRATNAPFASSLESIAPASESQQEVWSAAQLGDDASCAFNESVSLELTGSLNLAALQAAINDVATRHKALRASFSSDGAMVKIASSSIVDLALTTNADMETLIKTDVEKAFDLVTGPLFRFTLVSKTPSLHVLIMTAHHIVCDGWSTYLILKELGNRYRAHIGEDVAVLPAPDDLVAYNLMAADLAHTEAEDYWLDEFATIPPVVDFPTESLRPAMRTFDSRRIDIKIPEARVNCYRAFAKDHGASLFNLLLAGWYAYVARLTGTSDLVVGVPTAGQVSSGMTALVGHCVNLLPVRVTVDLHRPFVELVGNVQLKLSDALSNQEFTFGRLLKRIPISRDPSRIPIIPVQFNLDPSNEASALDYGNDLHVQVSTNPRSYENFELFINIAELGGELSVQLQFNSNLFSAEAISRRIEEFFTLLDSGCRDPTQTVSHLRLMTWEDELSLTKSTSSLPNLDHDRHFLELFQAQARAHPDATAVVGKAGKLTYGELEERSSNLAAFLAYMLPEMESSLIGVALDRNVDMLVSLLALWKVGAAYVPLDPEFPPERLAYMIEDANLLAVLVSGGFEVPGIPPHVKVISVDNPGSTASLAPIGVSYATDRPAYVIYTSGSTGKPKGVEIGHRALTNFLQSMAMTPGILANDTLVAVTTLSFDIAGLELFGPLISGASTVIATHEQTRDGAALGQLLKESGATLMQATPTTWRMLLDAGWHAQRTFRVLCGGEAFPPDLATELARRHDSIYNLYGPTEATVWSTVYPIDGASWTAAPQPVVPIGRPIHGTSVHVLDSQLQPLPPGVPGELFIAGVGLANRYLHREDLTQQRFLQHPDYGRLYRTGDLVTLDTAGILRFQTRIDSQVKVRGFRIELGEIEAIVASHPDVKEAVAHVYEATPGDLRLVAYYVARQGSIDEASLRTLTNDLLPRYMVPQHFVAIEAIPLTPNRKVDRKSLPAPIILHERLVRARNETEAMLVELWKEVLRADEVSVEDNFFNLGGHSILATRMISMLEDRSGIRVSLRTLFAGAVLADFAIHVAAAQLSQTDDEANPADREVLEF